MQAKSLQSCLTLCDPVDCSPPGSSVHGTLQARILERGARPSSRGSPQPRDRTFISYVSFIGRRVLYHEHHLGIPHQQWYLALKITNLFLCHKTDPVTLVVLTFLLQFLLRPDDLQAQKGLHAWSLPSLAHRPTLP